jgi:hypothetical protein
MGCKLPLFVTLFTIVALTSQSLFASTESTVGSCTGPGMHYGTIQAAIAAAASGATIDVCPGTYPEQVTISTNLTLRGIKNGTLYAPTIVVPSTGLAANGTNDAGESVAAQIFVKSADVTIAHLTVDGSKNGLPDCTINPMGIYYQNSSGTITANAVRNVIMAPAHQGCPVGLAINIESNSGTPAVTVSHNSVRKYDKGGIVASGSGTGGGPAVTVTGNTVIGIGATTATAQNGIQIGYGATGSVTFNDLADDLYTNPPCGGTHQPQCYAGSGILIYASSGITVNNNTVESTQLGIVTVTDPSYGTANDAVIKSNHIGGTRIYDAIDLCSDGNTAEFNTLYGSAQSGIHVDDGCSPSTGSNNTVTDNTINEACAGILLGTGTGNTTSPDNLMDVIYTTLAGDVCPVPVEASIIETVPAKPLALRASPYIPIRK